TNPPLQNALRSTSKPDLKVGEWLATSLRRVGTAITTGTEGGFPWCPRPGKCMSAEKCSRNGGRLSLRDRAQSVVWVGVHVLCFGSRVTHMATGPSSVSWIEMRNQPSPWGGSGFQPEKSLLPCSK